jgi:tetratricopeptide (TPR) repeat protein
MLLRTLRSSVARLQAIRAARAHNWDGAARAYATAAKFRPEVANLWVQYGNALKESGREREAEPAYRRAIDAAPDSVDAHLQLGHLLKRLGRVHDAVSFYTKAARLDPTCGPAVTAFGRLPSFSTEDGAFSRNVDPSPNSNMESQNCAGYAASSAAFGAPDGSVTIIFDVADLVTYFGDARSPTGIQRVQIEVVRGALLSSSPHHSILVCAYSGRRDAWIEIASAEFLRLCDLCLGGGDTRDPVWRQSVSDLNGVMLSSPEHRFRDGQCLVNLGTSWWLKNYFLSLRNVKRRYRVLYIPFVHDLIPVLMPER